MRQVRHGGDDFGRDHAVGVTDHACGIAAFPAGHAHFRHIYGTSGQHSGYAVDDAGTIVVKGNQRGKFTAPGVLLL